MDDGFDMHELDNYAKDLLNLANVKLPKESKKFMKKEGNKLNKKNKSVFNSKGIGEETGDLKKSFKSGKVYKFNGVLSIRGYSNAPHAHLLNYGWIHKAKNGNEKFIPGFHFMEQAAKNFEGEYIKDTEKFIDEMLETSGL